MLQLKVLSALEKVFPKEEPKEERFLQSFFKNEAFSFQVAFSGTEDFLGSKECDVKVIGIPLGIDFRIYEVKLIPSEYPCHEQTDDYYLSASPGLFPDLLQELHEPQTHYINGYWKSLWVELIPSENAKGGCYTVTIEFTKDGESIGICHCDFSLIDAKLPEQDLYFTQWFHSDCLCEYYNLEVFSDSYWGVVKNYFKMAVNHGQNMILTPILTPPLDTAVGGERLTVQLIKIHYLNNSYQFDFTNFRKWVSLAQECGFKYFEISHLFSQWGAKYSPKVIVHTEKGEEQKFGWHVSALSEEYHEFLKALLPSLTAEIKALGLEQKCFFHVSDEPSLEHIEPYKKAKDMIAPYISGFPLIDALSDFDFFKTGAVECPIPANDHIDKFLEAKADPLWTYYCTAQSIDVSNRFFAMPSARNRILAYQLFKFDIKGFLHWGYNFWKTQYSLRNIDPHKETDAGLNFPSGDAFSVYPGENGEALPSIRLKVFQQALYDLRAMKFLSSLSDKETVLKIIDPHQNMTFSSYPHSSEYILKARDAVNRSIKELLK